MCFLSSRVSNITTKWFHTRALVQYSIMHLLTLCPSTSYMHSGTGWSRSNDNTMQLCHRASSIIKSHVLSVTILCSIHSLASQTQPTPVQITFSIMHGCSLVPRLSSLGTRLARVILKVICTGVGWVWLARLAVYTEHCCIRHFQNSWLWVQPFQSCHTSAAPHGDSGIDRHITTFGYKHQGIILSHYEECWQRVEQNMTDGSDFDSLPQ